MPVLAYCATLNNYTADDVAMLRTPNNKLRYIIVGHEIGESGTPHLQIYFQLEKQAKKSTIVNWGGPWARMHLENARGTDVEASDYCKKEGNFFELGERKSMGRAGKRTDIDAIKQAIDDGADYDTLCSEHFASVGNLSQFIKERIQARDTQKRKSVLREQFETASLKPWQALLKDVVLEPPHPRRIHWIWDKKGNCGKSWMATYLGCMMNACVLTPGKKADLAYIYSQSPSAIVVFDLSRTAAPMEGKENWLDGVYSLAEDLKNGRLTTTKYTSMTIFFPPPHVIFFANWHPDMTKWSEDRYFVKEL